MLLTVDQAAERLGTTPRFIRRLRTERRIAVIKLGKHTSASTATTSTPTPPPAGKSPSG